MAKARAKAKAKPAGKAAAKVAPKAAVKAAPKSALKAAPKSVPKAAPKVVPKAIIARPAEKPVRQEKQDKIERLDKVETKVSGQPEPFRLVSIERTEPPSGASGKNWFRYNIRQGNNAINGYLQGTAAGVKHTAEQIVGQLNERRAGRWGYRTTRAAAPAAPSG